MSYNKKNIFDMDMDTTIDVKMMDFHYYQSMLKYKAEKIFNEIYGKKKNINYEKIINN